MYKITHFARRPSEHGRWVPLASVTLDENEVYRYGTEDTRHITPECIQDRVANGPLIALSEPVDFDPSQGKQLWLEGPDSHARVWFANQDLPMTDSKKKLVWSGDMYQSIR